MHGSRLTTSDVCCALVDFNNLWPTPRTDADVRSAFELLRSILQDLAEDNESIVEFQVRLYDGWIGRDGSDTEKHRLVRRLLPELNGLSDQVRIVAAIATRLQCFPFQNIIGTYRPKGGQKMVDQMLAQDLLSLGEEFTKCYVIARDEDFVPCLLGAVSRGAKVAWVRGRREVPNEPLLRRAKLAIIEAEAWIKRAEDMERRGQLR